MPGYLLLVFSQIKVEYFYGTVHNSGEKLKITLDKYRGESYKIMLCGCCCITDTGVIPLADTSHMFNLENLKPLMRENDGQNYITKKQNDRRTVTRIVTPTVDLSLNEGILIDFLLNAVGLTLGGARFP